MNTGLIFMTALMPTKGHDFLLGFASDFLKEGVIYCIIPTRSKEPTTFQERVSSFTHRHNIKFIRYNEDTAPQNPIGQSDTEFWLYWKNVVEKLCRVHIDYVFASETYGKDIAEVLGASFIPVDIERSTFNIKGSTVRENIFKEQDKLTKGSLKLLSSELVLFGPESCGKTTMAKRLASEFNGLYVCEWARPYLETVGPEITDLKMENIVKGQLALEKETKHKNIITFYDTDILSTYGFYKLKSMKHPEDLVSHLWGNDRYYIVMNDQIPFESDPLRYGITKRESDTNFWIEVLNEFKKEFYVVKETDHEKQMEECREVIYSRLPFGCSSYKSIINFKRD